MAELQSGALETLNSDQWAHATAMSSIITNPEDVQDPAWRRSLLHQLTEIVEVSPVGADQKSYESVLVDGPFVDYENNQFIEDSRNYQLKLNSTGTFGDRTLDNGEKGNWYMSIYELPDEIRELEIVSDDMVHCAAEIALTLKTASLSQEKFNQFQRGRGRDDKIDSVRLHYTGYSGSALMC